MARKISPLVLRMLTEGFDKGRADAKSIATVMVQSSDAIKSGTANAWNPFLGQLHKVAAEQKKLAAASRATANSLVADAKKAESAAASAAASQKQSAEAAAAALKSQADAAVADYQRMADAANSAASVASKAQSAANRQATAPPDSGGDSAAGGDGLSTALTVLAANLGAESLKGFSDAITKTGSDAVETRNLISESFGASTGDIQKWGESLHATLGVSSLDAQKSAGVFNVMFSAMGLGEQEGLKMSKTLTELSNDMQSFYNLDPGEAFDKLKSAITGESEPMRALGVVITDETTKQYAYAQGIAAAGAELTEQQKVLARFGQIMEQTSKSQGDLARTMNSPANVARRLGTEVTIASQQMGEGAAVVRAAWQRAATGLLSSFNESAAGAEKFAGGVIEAGNATAQVLTPIWSLAQAGLAVRDSLNIARLAKIANAQADAAGAIAAGTNATAQVAAGNAAAAAAPKWAMLARAKALASSPFGKVAGVIGAGAIVGAGVYNATRGDKPSAGEIGSYYWNRLTGHNANDSAVIAMGGDPNAKGDAAEQKSLEFTAQSAARRKTAAQVQSTLANDAPTGSGAFDFSAPSGADVGAGDKDPFADQIRALQRQKRDLKGKENAAARDALTAQIDGLQDSQRNWKEAHRESVKTGRDAEREAKAAGKIQDSDDLALVMARNDIASSALIEKLQGELDAAKDANNSAEVGRLTLAIETEKAKKQYRDAMARADQEKAGKHQNTLRQIADLNYQADLNRARAVASKVQSQTNGRGGKGKGLSPAEAAALFRATGATMNSEGFGFPALNPAGAGDGGRFAGMGDFVMGGADSSPMVAGVPSLSNFGKTSNDELRKERRIRTSQMQKGNGNRVITFKVDPLEIPYGGIADVEVG